MSADKEIKVHLTITTDCGYGFDGTIPLEKVKQIMEFSANCITSVPMALIASRVPREDCTSTPPISGKDKEGA